MNIFYKYCDQKGIEILRSLELKLPYISDVNDPLECLPFFYCPDDKSAMKEHFLRTLARNNIPPPDNWEQNFNEQFETGMMHKELEEGVRELQRDFNQKNCLLSVSKTAQNTVMWAHYTVLHKGIVIGIDFDKMHADINGSSVLELFPVNYSKDRYVINVLKEFDESFGEESFLKTILTKSYSWKYEEEFRMIFSYVSLKEFWQDGLAIFKDFNGKNTWFLRLNPESIREVIFGLYTDDGLKSAISKLIDRKELEHVKLLQVEESETYTFNLRKVI